MTTYELKKINKKKSYRCSVFRLAVLPSLKLSVSLPSPISHHEPDKVVTSVRRTRFAQREIGLLGLQWFGSSQVTCLYLSAIDKSIRDKLISILQSIDNKNDREKISRSFFINDLKQQQHKTLKHKVFMKRGREKKYL